MIFKIILKTKNEDDLIDTWIRYYSKLVGKENIIIFDNNSTSQKVLDTYKEHEIDVIKIDTPNYIHLYQKNKCFYDNLFVNCDWFSILDTDEFLCVYDNGIFFVDGVIDCLRNSSHKVLGSKWLQHIHFKNSIDHFRIEGEDHGKKYGKAVFNTSYEKIKNVIYGHNVSCNDVHVEPNLFLLHLDRLNPELRIKNCIEMCLHSSSIPYDDVENNGVRMEINKEIRKIKETNMPSDNFLSMTFSDSDFKMNSLHKLREIQHYYLDKQGYLSKYYGGECEYIKTNVINHYIYGEEYKQEIKVINKIT